MERLIHCQTVMDERTLLLLKRKTGENSTKDALMKAINHYLVCHSIREGRK
jgi:hypothetical protein